ncbi:Holliday junction DNA helicase [Mycoplasmopsis maculosa]|uniref:Holliday junction branch migration complex subunit RuvA n=1 Tax=Mycoplasmopsis maculosa TaxID=114885 RepID=A0A449B5A6_9BACT|nr:Holliday junction branch migration protein RuvA [Mycoplasmopsis maculosa]VEU75787.1 Holliday junction DNA helicase [Mycoplasmopsis maculosa]
MILYRIGEIVYKNNSNIIFESQGVGYSLIIPKNERVEKDQKLKLYLYEIRNDYLHVTYAFKDFKERLLFIDLIKLNGIGPKVAFNILDKGWEKMASIISLGDFQGLLEANYLNNKNAKLIIAELQEKWKKIIGTDQANKNIKENVNINEVKQTLKILGFKSKQIDNALLNIKHSENIEDMVEEAIKIISTYNYENAIA